MMNAYGTTAEPDMFDQFYWGLMQRVLDGHEHFFTGGEPGLGLAHIAGPGHRSGSRCGARRPLVERPWSPHPCLSCAAQTMTDIAEDQVFELGIACGILTDD